MNQEGSACVGHLENFPSRGEAIACAKQKKLEDFCKEPVASLWSISSLTCLFGDHWNILYFDF